MSLQTPTRAKSQYFAQPYSLDATGFYFETYEECIQFWKVEQKMYPYQAEKLCEDMLGGENTFGPESEWTNEEPSSVQKPKRPSYISPVPGGSGEPPVEGERGKVELPEGWGGIVKSTVSDMDHRIDTQMATLAVASATFLTYILRSKRTRLFSKIMKNLRQKSERLHIEVQNRLYRSGVATPVNAQ